MVPIAPLPPEWITYTRELGLALQQARTRRGMSQERVAHAAGISGFTYQKFEKGESRPGTPMNPRLTTLVALCSVLEISLVELLPADPPDLGLGR
ncbi:helix-turn-helix domain-containing protein [Aeromicrobium sp. Root495]|uniref:helix-turn-helix domain-containing protein n=1 Tax=Aeromicrobium sp. Root495 TaxID=1736550 RepID=UPI001F32DC10|nr:helix-turn-helix transcriptional regulator [Aeromicrobium sp. Root495]